MDDQTPHRRRRPRIDPQANTTPENANQPPVFPADPFPHHVAQSERSRPRSASTLGTPQDPARLHANTSVGGYKRRTSSDGVTHAYLVSDEPVRRSSPAPQSAAPRSKEHTYYYPSGAHETTSRTHAQTQGRPAAGTQPRAARPAAPSQRTSAPQSTAPHHPSQRTSASPNAARPAAPSQRTSAPQSTAPHHSSQQRPSAPPQGYRRSPSSRLVQGYRPEQQTPPPRSSYGDSGGNLPPRRKGPLQTYLLLAVAAVLIVGVLAGVFVGGSYLVEVKDTLNAGEGVFYSNLYINNIALGGMTKEQALAVVGTQVQQQVDAFSITIASTTGQSWTIDKTSLSMAYDVEERVNELWRIGHEGNAATRYEQVQELKTTPIYRYTALSYDITSVSTILSQIKADVDRAPVNATRISDNTVFPPFAYTSEQVGYSLDISAAYTDICGMIDRLESGTITLTPSTILPTVTKAQLQSEIQQIGYYETKINTAKSNEGRTMNVTMGCQKFNHMVVANGARVSFNDTTGKRNEKNGWYPALEIAYGEYTTGYGGGICQVSSTLYNACISAGLEIVRRTQHGLEVGYIDKGLDATVTNEGPDFIFRNNTGAEIYIAAGVEARGNAKYCVFIIYGRPDPNGHIRYLEGRIVEELPIPAPTIKDDKDENGDGIGDKYGLVYLTDTKEESEGRVGFKVETYLITKDKDGNVVSEEYRYTDTFKAIAPVIYVGTMSID